MLPFLRVDIDLGDEGYLVYGVSKLLDGEIPIRDFRAYDPGRYYWCGLFALIFGRGFLAARIAMAAAMILALGALAALVLSATNAPVLTISTCTLAMVWMRPRHKQIENLFVILSLLLLFKVSSNGGASDYLLLGATLGLSAFFGLNIAAYMLGASLLVFIVFPDTLDFSNLMAFAIGGLLGCLPIFALMIRYQGYCGDYYQRKVSALIKRRSTNLKLPLAWIWADGKTNLNYQLRFLFTVMPMAFLAGLTLPFVFTAGDLEPPLRLAFVASCVGIVAFYHTVSRADLGHMFLPMLPFCVLIVVIMHVMFGPIAASLLLATLTLVSVRLVWTHPFDVPVYLTQKQGLVPFNTATECLFLPAASFQQMERLQNVINRWTLPGDPILSVPSHIGLCAMTMRSHAVYDTFPVYPSTAPIRKIMIDSLHQSRPKLMLIGTNAVDQRTELMFLTNYPEVSDFIATEYVLSEKIGLIEVYLRRDL
jgi:hypothetical protein